MERNRKVREMRDAETVLNIIRDRGQRGLLPLERSSRKLENGSPESYVIRKSVMRSSEGGRRKSAYTGNSPAAYPTARTVLRGGWCSNAPSLPDKSFTWFCFEADLSGNASPLVQTL